MVESASLKRAIEDVYAQFLPRGGHPFVYVSLQMPPSDLDVNVHPTKREIHLLKNEQVVAAVQMMLRDHLFRTNASRTFISQHVSQQTIHESVTAMVQGSKSSNASSTRACTQSSLCTDNTCARAGSEPSKIVRTCGSMLMGELERYVKHPSATAPLLQGCCSETGQKGHREPVGVTGCVSQSYGKDEPSVASNDRVHLNQKPGVVVCSPSHACASQQVHAAKDERPWVSCELTSIQVLLRRVSVSVLGDLEYAVAFLSLALVLSALVPCAGCCPNQPRVASIVCPARVYRPCW